MKTVVRAAIVCAALLSGETFADGVPLITPGPALASDDAVRKVLASPQDVVKLHAVTINRLAFGANVLTIELDGKQYRFVGSMQKPFPDGETEGWGGKSDELSKGGALLSLTRIKKTGDILGQIRMPGRTYDIQSTGRRSVVVERDPNLATRMLPFVEPPASGPLFILPKTTK